jgi:hypothetical protein
MIAHLQVIELDPYSKKLILGPHGLAIENLKRIIKNKEFNIFIPNYSISFNAEVESVEDNHVITIIIPKETWNTSLRKTALTKNKKNEQYSSVLATPRIFKDGRQRNTLMNWSN